MLLVDVYLDQSEIQGIGVFAAEQIQAGQQIWQLVKGFDIVVTHKRLLSLPKRARDIIQHFGVEYDDFWFLGMDKDRYINHSDSPNTDGVRALKDIEIGEEITVDYRSWADELEFLDGSSQTMYVNAGLD